MSKIVCDICGTTYDAAAGKCPVCDWSPNSALPDDLGDFDADFLKELDEPTAPAKPAATVKAAAPGKPAAAPTASAGAKKTAFDYDAANQRRRPAPQTPAAAKAAASIRAMEEEEEEEESGSNTFLVIILVLLILALLAVSAYIGWTKILKPKQMGSAENKPQETISSVVDESNPTVQFAETTEATEAGIPCVSLKPVGNMEKLTFKGQYWRLMVTAEPENTTDKIIYSSNDENVVTIDEYGRVTAVGEGETTILVTCGSQSVTIPAVVSFKTETAETEAPSEAAEPIGPTAVPSDGTTTTTTTATGTLKLKKTDITLYRRGVYFTLELEGGITADDVKWSTSDSGIANVYNGVVTAIGRGVCVVTAEYNGQTAQCVVRCKF